MQEGKRIERKWQEGRKKGENDVKYEEGKRRKLEEHKIYANEAGTP